MSFSNPEAVVDSNRLEAEMRINVYHSVILLLLLLLQLFVSVDMLVQHCNALTVSAQYLLLNELITRLEA